jgi:CspA family cold shock protein
MPTGRTKWFNESKGYGFIESDAGGDDVFIHISALQRSNLSSLNEGQKVSFDLEINKRTGKSAAANIQVLS